MNRGDLIAELKEKEFKVLTHGYIKLVDVMGSDQDIIEAARLTSQKTGQSPAADRGLLRYLMRHRHSTPIEMCEIKLHVCCPMDLWRQWVRHRTATINEYSTRYSPAIEDMDSTEPDKWRTQSKNNRQGSSGHLTEWPSNWDEFDVTQDDMVSPGLYLSEEERSLQKHAREVYEARVKLGVALEQARKDLPLSTYTKAYWKIDLHNLFHFLGLRMDPHAQWEIRQYANIIGLEIIRPLFPWAFEAFEDYRLNAISLSALDVSVLRALVKKYHTKSTFTVSMFMYCQHEQWLGIENCRERDECLVKLQKLGLVEIPDVKG